jgi:hypothetical protein
MRKNWEHAWKKIAHGSGVQAQRLCWHSPTGLFQGWPSDQSNQFVNSSVSCSSIRQCPSANPQFPRPKAQRLAVARHQRHQHASAQAVCGLGCGHRSDFVQVRPQSRQVSVSFSSMSEHPRRLRLCNTVLHPSIIAVCWALFSPEHCNIEPRNFTVSTAVLLLFLAEFEANRWSGLALLPPKVWTTWPRITSTPTYFFIYSSLAHGESAHETASGTVTLE